MAAIAYLNGHFLPLDEARISPLDRGFLFADGVYEVIPVYGGRPFRLAAHLRRLEQSLHGIRLSNPLTPTQWTEVIGSLIDRNGGGDQSVYLQVTRGVAPRNHAFPEGCEPTVFAMSNPMPPPADDLSGVAAMTAEDIRWQYCHLKTTALLANILMRQQAADAGCYETILIRDGEVTEGAASNVFIVRDGHLMTPPATHLVLPGITRDVVLELAAAEGVPHSERRISRSDLTQADEIWLTSSTREIVAVTELDGHTIGDGRPGPLWHCLRECYHAFTDRLRRGETQQGGS